VRASDYHHPPSTIDPDQIVATRTINDRTLQIFDVGDHQYRLVENGTIVAPGIDPWAAAGPPTARQVRAFLRPRRQAFAALMDRFGIRANDGYQYEDAYDALYGPARLGRWVAVLGDETYYRIVNTRTAGAACTALAEAVGHEYLGLPIAVIDLDTGTSHGFRVSVQLIRPRRQPDHRASTTAT
jgi:hypothetical protein